MYARLPLTPSSGSNLITMERPLADDDALRQHDTVLRVLAEEHGLMDLALGDGQAEIIATVAPGRTCIDVARFELAAADLLGVVVHVTPSSAPGAHVRAPLAAAA
jgi:hypothetical protein